MAKCYPNIPHLLGSSYEVLAIEPTFVLPSDNGLSVINPELALASRRFGHLVSLEAKSGPGVNPDQLRRYIASRDLDWEEETGFPCEVHDFVYACAASSFQKLYETLRENDANCPVNTWMEETCCALTRCTLGNRNSPSVSAKRKR